MTRALLVIAIGVCALCVPRAQRRRRHPYQSHPMAGWCCPLTNTARCANAPTLNRPTCRRHRSMPRLTRIDYDLRIENDAVAGRALLTIDVLRDGWTRVQIPAGLMVRDARTRRTAGARSSRGRRRTSCSRAPVASCSRSTSRSPLTVVRGQRVDRAAGVGVTDLARRPDAAAQRRRSVGDRRLRRRSRRSHAGESRWTTFGRPNQPLTLSWKRKVDDRRAEQPLRTRARVTTLVGLGEDVSQVAAAVRRRSPAGPRARGRAGYSAGPRDQSGERRDGRRLGRHQRHAARAAARSGHHRGIVRRAGRNARAARRRRRRAAPPRASGRARNRRRRRRCRRRRRNRRARHRAGSSRPIRRSSARSSPAANRRR